MTSGIKVLMTITSRNLSHLKACALSYAQYTDTPIETHYDSLFCFCSFFGG